MRGSGVSAVLLFWLLTAPLGAQARLTPEELSALYKGAPLSELSREELDQCLSNPTHLKLLTLCRDGNAARVGDTSPAPISPEDTPGFAGLTAAAPGLADDQLALLFGPERLASMSKRRRDRWRTDRTLGIFHGAYVAGRMTLEKVQSLARDLLRGERPVLVTRADRPLRDQLPLRGEHFSLGLSSTTGWFYVERERAGRQRDQQIANVWAALADEDHESEIAALLRLIATHGMKPREELRRVEVLLNLKMLHRGKIGTFGIFDCISLGMENPWLSPNMDIKSLRAVLAHELGHFLQNVLYGMKPSVGLIDGFAGLGHNPEVTTNASLAFSEGWADYCGVVYGKGDVWEYNDRYRHRDGDAKKPLKSRSEMLSTEGLVTRLLLLSEAKLPEFRSKAIAVLVRHKPTSVTAFVDAYAKDHRAGAATLRRILEDVVGGK